MVTRQFGTFVTSERLLESPTGFYLHTCRPRRALHLIATPGFLAQIISRWNPSVLGLDAEQIERHRWSKERKARCNQSMHLAGEGGLVRHHTHWKLGTGSRPAPTLSETPCFSIWDDLKWRRGKGLCDVFGIVCGGVINKRNFLDGEITGKVFN